MRRRTAGRQRETPFGRSGVNTSAPLDAKQAEERVLEWQTKLHRWAGEESEKRFGDLFNLVCDPATLLVAWERVKRNRGSRTAGVDGTTRERIERQGVQQFLGELRQSLRERSYAPLPVREHAIPKRGSGKVRKLGIPALADRIVADGGGARARADLRGGLQPDLVRLPARAPSTGRHRRSAALDQPTRLLCVRDRG